MTRSGLAKGANKGHITEKRERIARPSQSKGVSLQCFYDHVLRLVLGGEMVIDDDEWVVAVYHSC